MDIQIKKAVKAGNSSAVILPRAWLNKDIRVELIKKTHESMLYESLEIIKKYIKLEEIISVYLTGSYARGEEDENSDIDILVITNNTDKEMICEGIYNILLVSEQLLKQKLEQDLFPVGQMIKEAKALLNSHYLDSIEVKVTKKNVKWYIDTTQDKIKLIKRVIEKAKKDNKKINGRVIYTLILRIRTLYIIKKLIENKDYSKKEFLKIIKNISKGNSYEEYLNVKNELKDEKRVSVEEAEELYNYLEKELTEVKRLLGI